MCRSRDSDSANLAGSDFRSLYFPPFFREIGLVLLFGKANLCSSRAHLVFELLIRGSTFGSCALVVVVLKRRHVGVDLDPGRILVESKTVIEQATGVEQRITIHWVFDDRR